MTSTAEKTKGSWMKQNFCNKNYFMDVDGHRIYILVTRIVRIEYQHPR